MQRLSNRHKCLVFGDTWVKPERSAEGKTLCESDARQDLHVECRVEAGCLGPWFSASRLSSSGWGGCAWREGHATVDSAAGNVRRYSSRSSARMTVRRPILWALSRPEAISLNVVVRPIGATSQISSGVYAFFSMSTSGCLHPLVGAQVQMMTAGTCLLYTSPSPRD